MVYYDSNHDGCLSFCDFRHFYYWAHVDHYWVLGDPEGAPTDANGRFESTYLEYINDLREDCCLEIGELYGFILDQGGLQPGKANF